MGRKKLYHTEEERREQRKIYNKRHREKPEGKIKNRECAKRGYMRTKEHNKENITKD